MEKREVKMKHFVISTTILQELLLCLTILVSSCSSERRRYEKARSENTLSAYEDFLKKYPKSEHTTIINNLIDSIHFYHIKIDNSIDAYKTFIKQYPQSIYIDSVNFLMEEFYYNQAKVENSIDAYENFLKQYPQSRYNENVNSLIEKIYFTVAKDINSINAYIDFLKRYPNNHYTEEVKELLEKIYPSFSKEYVFMIESVSPITGKGEISFSKGSELNKIKISINVNAPIIDGKTCLGGVNMLR